MELTTDVVDSQVRVAVGNLIRDRWLKDVTDGVKEGVDEYIQSRESHLNFSLMVSTAMGLGWIVAPQAMAPRSMMLSVIGAGTGWASHFQSDYNDSLRDPEKAPGKVAGLKNRMIDRLQRRPSDFARRGDGKWLIEPIRQFIRGEVQAGSITSRNEVVRTVENILENLTLNGSNNKVIPTERGRLVRASKESIKTEVQRWDTLFQYSHRRADKGRPVNVSPLNHHVTTSNPRIIVALGGQEREADPLVQDWLLHNSWRLEILDTDFRWDRSWTRTVRHEKLRVTLARGGRATLPKPGTKGKWEITTGAAELPSGLKVTESDIRRALKMAPTITA
jgi:hypothetical protein